MSQILLDVNGMLIYLYKKAIFVLLLNFFVFSSNWLGSSILWPAAYRVILLVTLSNKLRTNLPTNIGLHLSGH